MGSHLQNRCSGRGTDALNGDEEERPQQLDVPGGEEAQGDRRVDVAAAHVTYALKQRRRDIIKKRQWLAVSEGVVRHLWGGSRSFCSGKTGQMSNLIIAGFA